MSPLVTEVTYVGAVLLASTFLLSLAVWLWSDAESLAAKLFVAWAASYPLIGLAVVGHVLSPTVEVAKYFYLAGATLSPALPITVFLFTLAYTGRTRWVSKRVVGVLGAWYAVLATFILTDPVLGLAYAEYVVVTEPFTYIYAMPTGLYSLVSLPLWMLMVAPPALLGARALSDSGITRAQTTALFLGSVIPSVAFFLWLGDAIPGPANGAFIISSTITGGLVALAVYRYHLFDLVPLAREMVFDELDDAVLVIDRDQRVLDYNRIAVETFPELEDSVGVDVSEVVPPLTDGDDDTAGPFPSSFTSYRTDEPQVYDVTASHLPSEESFRGYGLIVRDVTERRRRMRDLEQQTTQLERFASTLSHDIRNPLNVAQGHIELAIEEADRSSLQKADDAIERIEQIVDDLLTLSREGRTIDDRQFVGLAAVAESAWETTETGDATLDVSLDPGEGVYADDTRLRNVFENLFRNALEFGGEDVTVRVGRRPDGFFVEDDGPGVPADQRDRVFDYEYTTAADGTGLGLAIVDSIARAHGWCVDVTDGSDGGARFVFSDVDVVQEPSPSAATSASANGTEDGKSSPTN